MLFKKKHGNYWTIYCNAKWEKFELTNDLNKLSTNELKKRDEYMKYICEAYICEGIMKQYIWSTIYKWSNIYEAQYAIPWTTGLVYNYRARWIYFFNHVSAMSIHGTIHALVVMYLFRSNDTMATQYSQLSADNKYNFNAI